jgi:hypothetical protein
MARFLVESMPLIFHQIAKSKASASRQSKTYGPPRLNEAFEDGNWSVSVNVPGVSAPGRRQNGDPRSDELSTSSAHEPYATFRQP